MKPGSRYEGMDRTGRRPHVFVRDESGEPAYYCGPADDRDAVRIGMGHIMANALEGALSVDEDQELWLEVWWMTPQEVAELPDC